MSNASKPSPKDPALSRLIGDITVRKMNKDQIREHYKQGRYAGASDAHIVGYINQHRGA